MTDSNVKDIISHKGKRKQKYSLALKKEVIVFAEVHRNRPASWRFQLDEKRVQEWRANKINIQTLLETKKGKERSLGWYYETPQRWLSFEWRWYPITNHLCIFLTDLAKSVIVECVRDIDAWMTVNMLQMNRDKTELVVLSASHHVPPPSEANFGLWSAD